MRILIYKNFPKGAEEKMPCEETQREQGSVCGGLARGALIPRSKCRYFINEDFCSKCLIILFRFVIMSISSPSRLLLQVSMFLTLVFL